MVEALRMLARALRGSSRRITLSLQLHQRSHEQALYRRADVQVVKTGNSICSKLGMVVWEGSSSSADTQSHGRERMRFVTLDRSLPDPVNRAS